MRVVFGSTVKTPKDYFKLSAAIASVIKNVLFHVAILMRKEDFLKAISHLEKFWATFGKTTAGKTV